jgi:pectinesterase
MPVHLAEIWSPAMPRFFHWDTLPVFVFCCFALLIPANKSGAQDVHVYVAPDNPPTWTGNKFPTIQMAMDHAPEPGPDGRLYVHIAPATYHERVVISPLRPRTTFLGQGSDPSQVVITASQNAKSAGGTFFSETVEVIAPEFEADNVTFENAAGPTGQAVAIAVNADRAVFKHCRFVADQDTLFANFGRQYYVDSYIAGGVDFIFGNATAFFENDEIHAIRPGYLTAQSRTSPKQTTGYVFNHARITAEDTGGRPIYLGRPWRIYSRVVFLRSFMPSSISPEGWSPWKKGETPADTYYAEWKSEGPGANPSERVSWSKQLSKEEAAQFSAARFLAGDDHWDAAAEAARLP